MGEALSPHTLEARDDAPMSRAAWWVTLVALLCGAALLAATQWSIVARWAASSRSRPIVRFTEWRRLIVVGWALGLAAISIIPLFRRSLLVLIRRLRSVSVVGRRWTTLLVFVVATAYLLLTAHLQGRDFDMNIQDEMMYLVQAQLIAHGHLWLPAHPMADFFQELFLFHTPVYASMYFPGTALLYATTVWFHIPNWFLSAMISGAAVAMTYRVLAEMVDNLSGLLGAMLLVACAAFRWTSIMVMSHPLLMLQGLLMFWCFLHWRRGGRLRWLALFGALAGWAAVTRPIDAIAWATPPLACVALDLWRAPRATQVKALALMALAATPFLSLQLILDKGVTGRWLETPAQAFHHRYFPATFQHGGETLASADLPAALPQYKTYYQTFIIPGATFYKQQHLLERIPFGVVHTIPATWLLFFMPLGVVALATRRHWALAGVFVLFVLGYMTFMFFASHYLVVVTPIGLFIVVLGARQLERLVAAGPLKNFVACFAVLGLAATAVACLPELNKGMRDEPNVSQEISDFNRQMKQAQRPAVVFFHWQRDPEDPTRLKNPNAWKHEEVYNIDAAWPDDSPVVRVQDLGPRDVDLVRYYAERQPSRVFYRYQQDTRQLTRLGTATELRDDPRKLITPDMTATSKPATQSKKSPDDPD
jgi:hypothetical protein